jgi:hypothetical protein
VSDSPSLFAHPAVLGATSLDLITSHLMLFAPSVYLNCRVRPEDQNVDFKLREFVDSRLIVPWALPGEAATKGSWASRQPVREIEPAQYARTADIVRATTSYATTTFERQQTMRPIEIVQLSSCAWQCGLAESLESERVVGPRRSYPALLATLRRTNYQQNIAQEFMDVVANLPVNLSALPIDDIVVLQSRYRRAMAAWLSKHISSWPAEIGWATDAQANAALRDLLQAYSADSADALSRRRQGPVSRTASLVLDILGFFLWPAGLVSIVQNIGGWWQDHREFRVEWFLADLKKAADAQGKVSSSLYRKWGGTSALYDAGSDLRHSDVQTSRIILTMPPASLANKARSSYARLESCKVEKWALYMQFPASETMR